MMDLAALFKTFGDVAAAAQPLLEAGRDARESSQSRTAPAQSTLIPGELGGTLSNSIGRTQGNATDPAVEQILQRIGAIEKAVGVKNPEEQQEPEEPPAKEAPASAPEAEQEESFSLDDLLNLFRRAK